MTPADDAAAACELVIQVVRGQPDPAELVAVTLVLLAAARARDPERGSPDTEPGSRDAARAVSWPAPAARYCPPCSWQVGPAAAR